MLITNGSIIVKHDVNFFHILSTKIFSFDYLTKLQTVCKLIWALECKGKILEKLEKLMIKK